MDIVELKKIVDDISHEELADEFLDWLTNNVDQYIDNHQTKFIINISPKEAGDMPLAERVEELYQDFDDQDIEASLSGDGEFDWSSLTEEQKKKVDEETEKLNLLHDLVKRAYDYLLGNKEGLKKLFEALVYYYEVVGLRDQTVIEKQLGGGVNVSAFHYEAVSVPVEIKGKRVLVDEDGNPAGVEETAATTYMIPPSFVIDLELEMFEKRPQTTMF